ncbi:MAG: V-type ATP synthase subunit F [Candidatus Hydrogenedentes bacterium]|nr:V-type ATP synthase subunit F [Candidatus Hydrogenedentota bacterium]
MEFFVIGDRDTVLGMRLAGVAGCTVTDRASASDALRDALARENTGVVLLTEPIAAQLRDEVASHMFGAGWPILLEIPDASGPSPDRPSVADIVRKATGISL